MHDLRVDPERNAHASDLVGVGDLEGVKTVVDELRKLGLAIAHGEDRGVEVPVHFLDRRRGLAVMRSHDNLRRVEKVFDRSRFPQEFGIVDHIDDGHRVPQRRREDRKDESVDRARANGAAVNDRQLVLSTNRTRGAGDLPRHFGDVAHVVGAVWGARRPDADDRDLGRRHGIGRIGRAAQAPLRQRVGKHLVEPRLLDRRGSRHDPADLVFADVDAHHLVAFASEANRSGQTHITEPVYCDPHWSPSFCARARTRDREFYLIGFALSSLGNGAVPSTSPPHQVMSRALRWSRA